MKIRRRFTSDGLFFALAAQELRRSQLESAGDPVQSGGVLLHVVQLWDLRGGAAREVRRLPGRQGFEAAVRRFIEEDQRQTEA